MSQEVEVFSPKFRCDKWLKVPLAKVKMDECQDVLKAFLTLFSCHPDEENVELWLLEKESDYTVLLTCSHFEEAGPQEVASLSVIVTMLAQLSENWESILNYVSSHGEKVIFEIFNPIPELIEAIRKVEAA